MIQESIQHWIQHPESLSEESLHTLHELLTRYPYFQTARLLYLKNLYLLQHSDFENELRKSVLYIADLSVLFYFIEGVRLVIEKHTESSALPAGTKSDRTLDLIDRFLAESSEMPTDELPLPAEAASDYASVLLEEESKTDKLASLKGQDLIDRFIGNEPSLPEPEEETQEKPNDEHSEEEEKRPDADDEAYFTETLAKIYVKQHRYEKALEIIRKLNLKYPKKNAYFADQIRFLEKLIINAKSK